MAYKVFTNGSTLQASELNENLMQQSIAVFSNSAARTAAITSPVEGQMTYLEDTDRYASWNGSSWVSPFGLTLLKTVTVGTAVSTIVVNDVFSSEFDNYKIVISGITPPANVGFNIQFGSANSLYFATANNTFFDGSSANSGQTSGSSAPLPNLASNGGAGITLEVYNPFLALRTGFTGQGIYYRADGSGGTRDFGGFQNSNTSFTSFTLFPSSSTVTGGTVSVYGYRKS